MNQKYKTLLFDFDGTLHQSMHIYAPAFRKAFDLLSERYGAPKRSWSDEAIEGYLGQNPKEMWDAFKDQYSEEARAAASQCITDTMKALIDQNKAKLYEGTIETLETLKNRGYTMIIVSNTKAETMKKYRQMFNLDAYFSDYVCSDQMDYQPKEVMIKHLLDDYEGPCVMIGDRHHDMRAGIVNHLTTVACLYGYGQEDEFTKADYQIMDVRELKALFL